MKEDKNLVFKWIIKIYETLDNSELDKEKLKSIRDEVIRLRAYLGTDDYLQTYIFSIIFICKIEDLAIDMTRILNYLNLKLHENLYVIDAVEKLFSKHLIKVDEVRRWSINHVVLSKYTINKKLLQCILNSKKIDSLLLTQQNDVFQFLKEVSGAISRQLTNNNKEELYELLEKIENENNHLSFIDSLVKLSIDVEDRTLLYELACNYFETLGKSSNLKFKLISAYGVRDGLILLKEFIENQSTLQYFKLIEITRSQFADDVDCNLTDKAAELIFGEDAVLLKFNKQTNDMLLLDSKSNDELFFEKEIQDQIDYIEKVVSKDKFQILQRKLLEKGMPQGIVILLYGEAGTGKSAVIRSIAKHTNRQIFEVNGSMKDKYYGETERKTKELFDNYNIVCEKDKDSFPLMVIDEADQLITRRLENTSEQIENTSNSQQNIILTALERNRGIIFLTTNMVGNMLDAGALERRINFKVEFKKPSEETTFKVWKSNLSFLDDKKNDFLNKNYQLSPGQINNIQKKVIFDEVIENKTASFEKIIGFCNSERGIRKDRKNIGFKTR